MVKQDWPDVLDAMYQEGITLAYTDEEEYEIYHQLVEETGLGVNELKAELELMEDLGLLERIGEERGTVRLSQRGFDKAHDREQFQQQQETNNALAVATLGLFGVALIQALATIYTVPEELRLPVTVFSVFILLLLGLALASWSNQRYGVMDML